MSEPLWNTILFSFLVLFSGSFFIEKFLNPQPLSPWRRPASSLLIHSGVCLLLYFLLILILRRPWFAAASIFALFLLLVLISNAKYRSLREPFIYQDFSYFIDAIRFPRLYLPFLGLWSGFIIVLLTLLVTTAGFLLEQPVELQSFSVIIAAGFITGSIMLITAMRGKPCIALQPEKDLELLGLVASLWHYAKAERQPWKGDTAACFYTGKVPGLDKKKQPNIVVVQSESFFDPRCWNIGIRPELLKYYDLLKRESAMYGALRVPAWGGNTVRTEFSFLSGISNERLGIHRFKPYRRLARQGVPTIASYLRDLGYRTVCIHPYHSGFYKRRKVFPLLGFEEFIDISDFKAEDYEGQYVGDVAVAKRVSAELAKHDAEDTRPLFLFVITMENHGPLHLEKAVEEDRQRFYIGDPPEATEQLTVYLRHLEQADLMFEIVRKQFLAMKREGWFCLYGDHPPIMPDVYKKLGEPDRTVDYLFWFSRGNVDSLFLQKSVEELPSVLIDLAGLNGSRDAD